MQTQLVRSSIRTHFGGFQAPSPAELVKHDGFDELEKEDALRFFPGKSWQDLLNHLRSIAHHPTLGGWYVLEEWSVLEPAAISYYARAYLEHLIDTVESDAPDEFNISAFFGSLYQIVYSARHESMPDAEWEIFSLTAHCIAMQQWASSIDADFAPETARGLLAELAAKRPALARSNPAA